MNDEKSPTVVVQRVLPAYRQVADQLRMQIITGELSPGDRLPPEPQLAALFGVSRTTVREALRVLTAEGLATTKRGVGGGTSVLQPSPQDISEHLEVSVGLLAGTSEMTIDGLLEARRILEVPAARLAAARRTTEHIDTLQSTVVRLRHLDVGRQLTINRNFHACVVAATGNRLLEVMTVPVFRVLTARLNRAGVSGEFWDQVHDDHERIFEAISAGDDDAAAAEMMLHLEGIRPTYEALASAAEGQES